MVSKQGHRYIYNVQNVNTKSSCVSFCLVGHQPEANKYIIIQNKHINSNKTAQHRKSFRGRMSRLKSLQLPGSRRRCTVSFTGIKWQPQEQSHYGAWFTAATLRILCNAMQCNAKKKPKQNKTNKQKPDKVQPHFNGCQRLKDAKKLLTEI